MFLPSNSTSVTAPGGPPAAPASSAAAPPLCCALAPTRWPPLISTHCREEGAVAGAEGWGCHSSQRRGAHATTCMCLHQRRLCCDPRSCLPDSIQNPAPGLTCGPYRCSSSAAARMPATSVIVRPSARGREGRSSIRETLKRQQLARPFLTPPCRLPRPPWLRRQVAPCRRAPPPPWAGTQKGGSRGLFYGPARQLAGSSCTHPAACRPRARWA